MTLRLDPLFGFFSFKLLSPEEQDGFPVHYWSNAFKHVQIVIRPVQSSQFSVQLLQLLLQLICCYKNSWLSAASAVKRPYLVSCRYSAAELVGAWIPCRTGLLYRVPVSDEVSKDGFSRFLKCSSFFERKKQVERVWADQEKNPRHVLHLPHRGLWLELLSMPHGLKVSRSGSAELEWDEMRCQAVTFGILGAWNVGTWGMKCWWTAGESSPVPRHFLISFAIIHWHANSPCSGSCQIALTFSMLLTPPTWSKQCACFFNEFWIEIVYLSQYISCIKLWNKPVTEDPMFFVNKNKHSDSNLFVFSD